MIRAYHGVLPEISVSRYANPAAQMTGDVGAGERSKEEE
jgi:hypothetical protein